MIAPNSRARKAGKERGEVKREYGGVYGEEEENADYEGMVQPSQQHVAPCVKVVEWGFGTRGLTPLGASKVEEKEAPSGNIFYDQNGNYGNLEVHNTK